MYFNIFLRWKTHIINIFILYLGVILASSNATATNPTQNGQVQIYQTKQVSNFQNVNGTTEPMSPSAVASLQNMMNQANEVMNAVAGSSAGLPIPIPVPIVMF